MPVFRNRVFLLDVTKESLKAPVRHRRDHFHRVDSTRNKGVKQGRLGHVGREKILFFLLRFSDFCGILHSMSNCLLASVDQFEK